MDSRVAREHKRWNRRPGVQRQSLTPSPRTRLWYIYACVDSRHGIGYTGKTTNPKRRAKQHFTGRGAEATRGLPFDEFYVVDVAIGDAESDIREREFYYQGETTGESWVVRFRPLGKMAFPFRR